MTPEDGSVAIDQQPSQPSNVRSVQDQCTTLEEGIARIPEGKDTQLRDFPPALPYSHSPADVLEKAQVEKANDAIAPGTVKANPIATLRCFDHVEESQLLGILVSLSPCSTESAANALFTYFQGLSGFAHVVALHYLLGYVFTNTLQRPSSITLSLRSWRHSKSSSTWRTRLRSDRNGWPESTELPAISRRNDSPRCGKRTVAKRLRVSKREEQQQQLLIH